MIKKILFPLIFLFAGSFLALFINFLIIHHLIIPDPCKYHTAEYPSGFLFNLFYYSNSSTGYHPEPSTLNFTFTMVIGAVSGLLIYSKIFHKQ